MNDIELVPWEDYIEEHVPKGTEQAYLLGKGWSAVEFFKEFPNPPLPIFAINEMTSLVPYGVGIAMDPDPVFNVAKLSHAVAMDGDLNWCARRAPPMIMQERHVAYPRLARDLRRAGMNRVGLFHAGEIPEYKATAAWALHMLAHQGVREVIMAGFDLFFHPDDRTDGPSPYNEESLKVIRHGVPDPTASLLGRRSQCYGTVNHAMRLAINVWNLKVTEWRPRCES